MDNREIQPSGYPGVWGKILKVREFHATNRLSGSDAVGIVERVRAGLLELHEITANPR
jgi:hypothetical protein